MARTFHPAPWSDAASKALAPVLYEDAGAIRADVEDGHAVLWSDGQGSYLVTRIDATVDRRELVLVAGVGRAGREALAAFEDYARSRHCTALRWHTRGKGVARLAVRYGFQLSEYVLRKTL